MSNSFFPIIIEAISSTDPSRYSHFYPSSNGLTTHLIRAQHIFAVTKQMCAENYSRKSIFCSVILTRILQNWINLAWQEQTQIRMLTVGERWNGNLLQ